MEFIVRLNEKPREIKPRFIKYLLKKFGLFADTEIGEDIP